LLAFFQKVLDLYLALGSIIKLHLVKRFVNKNSAYVDGIKKVYKERKFNYVYEF
jgi:hypothetical protein